MRAPHAKHSPSVGGHWQSPSFIGPWLAFSEDDRLCHQEGFELLGKESGTLFVDQLVADRTLLEVFLARLVSRRYLSTHSTSRTPCILSSATFPMERVSPGTNHLNDKGSRS